METQEKRGPIQNDSHKRLQCDNFLAQILYFKQREDTKKLYVRVKAD